MADPLNFGALQPTTPYYVAKPGVPSAPPPLSVYGPPAPAPAPRPVVVDRQAYLQQQFEAMRKQQEEAARLQQQVEEQRSRIPLAAPLPALTQEQQGNVGGYTPEMGSNAIADIYKVARTDIPYADRVAQVAGEAGQRAGEGLFKTVAGPAAALEPLLPKQAQPSHIAGQVTGAAAESLIPTELWMAALEFAPGVGDLRGLYSAVRKGSPEAILALRKAGAQLGESGTVERAIKGLASESGKLDPGAIEDTGRALIKREDQLPIRSETSLGASDWEPARRVEGEILHNETGIAKAERSRLLPYQASVVREMGIQIATETPGTKLAKGVRSLGGRRLIDLINRSALNDKVRDLTSIITTAYRRSVDQGLQTNHVGMAYLTDRELPFQIGAEGVVDNLPKGSRFGPKATTSLVPQGTTTGGFEGEHILDIMERATRADVGAHLTPDQFAWITTARTIIDDAVDDFFAANGVKRGTQAANKLLGELGFAPGEHYIPRRVLGRNGVEAARAAGVGGRPTSEKFFQQTRVHEFVAKGVADGLDYDHPVNSIDTFLGAIRRATADSELKQIAKGLGASRKAAGVGDDAFIGAMSGIPFGRTGTIPVRESQLPGLTGWLFPSEVIDSVENHLLDTGSQWLRTVNRYSAPLRLSVAGFDVGTPLINGLPVLFRNPVAWGRAVRLQFAALKDPRVLQRYILDNRGMMQEYLDDGGQLMEPEFLQSLRPGGALHGLETAPIAGPVVRRAEASRDAFLTAGQLEMWKGMRGAARNDADRQLLMGINNDLMGVTNLPRTGMSQSQAGVENAVLWFASRFTKAPVALAGHLLGSRIGAQEAARSLATFAGGGALVMYGLAKAAGMGDDEIKTMFNPGSGGRFLSVRVKGQYIGIGGSFRAITQLVANSYVAGNDDPMGFLSRDSQRNPLLYYWRSRAAPLTGLGWTVATGKDFIGRPVDTWQDWLKVGTGSFTPPFIDAAIGAASGIDAAISSAAATLGARENPLSPRDRVMVAAEEGARGAGYGSFNAMKRKLGTTAAYAQLEESSPEFKKLRVAQKDAGQLRREDLGVMNLTDVLEPFKAEQVEADANPDLADPFAWREDRKARRLRQAGRLSGWEKDNPADAKELNDWKGDPFALKVDVSPDDLKAAYFKVFKAHQTATGGIDNQDALAADLDRFDRQLSEEQQSTLQANIGVTQTPREKAYTAATRTLGGAGYFDRRDKAFAVWKGYVGEAPLEVQQAAKSWDSPDDLKRWAEGEAVAAGYGKENYTRHPVWKGWQSSYDDQNGQFLAELGAAEDVAIEWGYQEIVHSQAAYDAYKARTGLEPKQAAR